MGEGMERMKRWVDGRIDARMVEFDECVTEWCAWADGRVEGERKDKCKNNQAYQPFTNITLKFLCEFLS